MLSWFITSVQERYDDVCGRNMAKCGSSRGMSTFTKYCILNN